MSSGIMKMICLVGDKQRIAGRAEAVQTSTDKTPSHNSHTICVSNATLHLKTIVHSWDGVQQVT